MKVKIIKNDNNANYFQDNINNFIKNKEIIDIKYFGDTYMHSGSVLIMYKSFQDKQ